ncbi:MAG: hypothetical protein JWM70_492 [Microbacteriaceae bacterium]|nr:hypothetical protein [Microbacteriaceae bacterium]
MKTHTITILSVIGVLGTATATMAINADALSSASQRPIDRASEVLVPGQSSTPSPFPTPFLTPFPTPSSTDDPATHDLNDDNGVDNPATHDVNDDNGGVVDDKSGSGSDSSGSGHGEDD